MPRAPESEANSLDRFSSAARVWFGGRFGAPTEVQRLGWERIAAGEHALLCAPTGSGKTLAAFFAAIDALTRDPRDEPGVRVLYVSPLKALVYDIERNLRAPLAGIAECAAGEGLALRLPRVAVRTGDTTAADRRRQLRAPAEILVTTPESLYLMLGSQQRESLRGVETLIVDEIHALAPSKRGAHLALSLERLAAECARDPQRIGLSATARPLADVARFLGGDRPVAIVDASARPELDLEIRGKPPEVARSEPQASEDQRNDPAREVASWEWIVPELVREIRAVRSAIVFTNSRGLCERLCQQLNEHAGEPLARAHHGSVAHDERRAMETELAEGRLRAIVATSSLELGIDMQAVDLVLLVESPGAVSRGLQRVGRAGHGVGRTSRGIVYPKHRGDLLEATVVAHGMRAGDVEALQVPQNPLDVLAQQAVAICAAAPTTVDALEALVRRAAPYRALSRAALEGVLDMLAGRYPSALFAELRARIHWDRRSGRLEARPGAKQLALVSGGTIPDRGLFAVHRGEGGPRIGELDEEMVNETRPGEVLTLGASSWRVDAITRDRVLVSPAPGEAGKLPFWRGDGPGRPLELGRALGAFVRELAERRDGEAWLREEYGLDAGAAAALVEYLGEQQEATGTLPSDRAVTLERYRDELGDWRVCILTPFGARVHAPWALAIEASLGARSDAPAQALWGDDGIVLRLPDADAPPDLSVLLPDPEKIEEQVVRELGHSALFASQFRENAARALLLPRRRPGARTPLFMQRLRAQGLLAVAREYPEFPIVLETYRSCLKDVFDVPALEQLLADVRARRVRVDEVETASASPFARSLEYAYTAEWLYEADTPAAERRARALTLDRHLLRDLLGDEERRGLLDAGVIAETEALLQGRAPDRRARDAEALLDRLRRSGDLSQAELAQRSDGDSAAWLAELARAGRALKVAIGGEPRWIAVEDAGLARDALGAALPPDVPAAFLAPAPDALAQWVQRHARSRGPFTEAELALRWGLARERLAPVLAALASAEKLRSGEFLPSGSGREYCDPEVLRRLRQGTLAKLRAEIAPVDGATLARFLAGWHGIGERGAPELRLRAALASLEALPLSFAELERLVLPARVAGYDPRMLDELGARGEWAWVGAGALGERDLRVAFFRRDRVSLLCDAPEPPAELGALERAALDALARRGASFLNELSAACGNPPLTALLDALWRLAQQGLVSNDTPAALRMLSGRRELGAAAARRRRAKPLLPVGRWVGAAQLAVPEDPTRRAHARALLLLERYGVVSREALSAEGWPGGFAGLYAVYRQMEEMGKLRRGHFVDALRGAQFAQAGAVDRLRAARGEAQDRAWLLASTDPANPYGALLPWPETRGDASLRRAAGATLALVGGTPALYLERSGKLATFRAADEDAIARAAAALPALFSARRRRGLRIGEIDGIKATHSPLFAAFARAGFHRDYKDIALDPR
jgi:ATP-dependent helicase Lhr and Lhr-like helicase